MFFIFSITGPGTLGMNVDAREHPVNLSPCVEISQIYASQQNQLNYCLREMRLRLLRVCALTAVGPAAVRS